MPSTSCSLGRIAVGATATATLIVDTDPNATTITNTGFSGSGGLDEFPEDNEDTATTPLRPVADLSVTKSGPSAVSAAAPVEYVIAFRNDGPSTATDVIVTDTLPAGLTPRPVDGCTITGSDRVVRDRLVGCRRHRLDHDHRRRRPGPRRSAPS